MGFVLAVPDCQAVASVFLTWNIISFVQRQIIFVHGIVYSETRRTFVPVSSKRRCSQEGSSPARVVPTACPLGTQQAKEHARVH
jgi:hypothetical protein